jgi:hypothetical protein
MAEVVWRGCSSSPAAGRMLDEREIIAGKKMGSSTVGRQVMGGRVPIWVLLFLFR